MFAPPSPVDAEQRDEPTEVGATPPDRADPTPTADVGPPVGRGKRRAARMGLSIQFESRPDDAELARLVETTIWVNDAHPAYVRAAASRAESYHITLAVALALSKVAVDPANEREFVLEFLARWGDAREASSKKPRRRR
jgi:hypothetical protein